jgi:hypothetical protein
MLTEMKSQVNEFIIDEVKKVRQLLLPAFNGAMSSESVDGIETKEWMTTRLCHMVAQDALEQRVVSTVTHCRGHEGAMEVLNSVVCFGLIPNAPKKREYPSKEHFFGSRIVRCLHHVEHKIESRTLHGSSDVFDIPNPMYSKSFHDYIVDWSRDGHSNEGGSEEEQG